MRRVVLRLSLFSVALATCFAAAYAIGDATGGTEHSPSHQEHTP